MSSSFAVLLMAFSTFALIFGSNSCILTGFLQCGQSLRMSRCAIIALTEAGRRNAGIPIFKIRVMVSAAEFVWIVDTTRCPVRAASMAILMVSWSRISHTMMISGS